MIDSTKLHYIVHVMPQNLRFTEKEFGVPGADLFEPPVWVVRPECAKDRTALVYGWAVVNGSVKSHTTPHDPLPGTDGHGWAYIECDALMVQATRDPDAWTDAAYLFTGVCSVLADHPITQWGAAKVQATDDDMTDASNLYSPAPTDVDDHGSVYKGTDGKDGPANRPGIV